MSVVHLFACVWNIWIIVELDVFQVMWSTFVPYVPPSVLPGSIFGAVALLLVILVHMQRFTILSWSCSNITFGWGVLLVCTSLTVVMALQNRLNKLPAAALKFYTGLSAWTATLLFMWGPVAQAVCLLDTLFSLLELL